MSLLTACQNVANECGYQIGDTVVGSTDQTSKQLLAIANRIINEMGIAYPWSKLFASASITLVDGQTEYELPAGFSYYHYETFWNQSTRWRVLGPMNEQEYGEIRGYGLVPVAYQRFQLRGCTDSRLVITPAPDSSTAGQVIVFEYMTDRVVRPRTWTGNGTGFHPDVGDYCSYNGNYYTAVDSAFTDNVPPTWTDDVPHSDGGVNWLYYSGSYTQFLNDNDEPILPQRVLEQGMLERFAEMHGLEGVQPRFNDQLQEVFGNDIPGKILYAAGAGTNAMFARSNRVVFGTIL